MFELLKPAVSSFYKEKTRTRKNNSNNNKRRTLKNKLKQSSAFFFLNNYESSHQTSTGLLAKRVETEQLKVRLLLYIYINPNALVLAQAF